MAITRHPPHGSIVCVNFHPGFTAPEMVKKRLCVVFSRPMGGRENLVSVVPLSTSQPEEVRPYHMKLMIPFDLPKNWGQIERWVKGDMITPVGFHRIDLLRLEKGAGGRVYQYATLPSPTMINIQRCVLHGLGMSSLTRHL